MPQYLEFVHILFEVNINTWRLNYFFNLAFIFQAFCGQQSTHFGSSVQIWTANIKNANANR